MGGKSLPLEWGCGRSTTRVVIGFAIWASPIWADEASRSGASRRGLPIWASRWASGRGFTDLGLRDEAVCGFVGFAGFAGIVVFCCDGVCGFAGIAGFAGFVVFLL
ncbi:hypothetical protein FCV25MIE_14723 [Fagus crenata]